MGTIKPIKTTPVPGTGGSAGGLGARLKQSLLSFAVDFLNRVRESVSDILRHAADNVLESFESPLAQMARPLLNKAIATPGIPQEIKSILVSARDQQFQVGAILLAFTTIFILPPVINALFDAPIQLVRYVGNKTFRPNRLDFGTWYAAMLRDPKYAAVLTREMLDLGWTDEQIQAAKLVAEQRLGVSDVLLANVREIMPDGEMSRRLAASGVPAADAGILQRLTEQIPGPSDLVRFGTREAWRDDIAAAYGYDQGMPAPLVEWMQKQGFGPEWSKAFWRSHWVIPSAGQLFEMFHRGEISQAELFEGLQTNDIAPGWLRPLLGITYNLLTRVDVKRALRYGELSIEQVSDEYRKQGYDDRDSRILTNIALQETVQEAAGLTRSAVVASYKKRRMSRSEAIESLADIGVIGQVAEFYLDQADADRADELLQRRIDILGKRFVDGTISEGETRIALGSLGVGGAETDVLIEEWVLRRSVSVRRPSRSNLDEFFRQQVIGVDRYRAEMASLGYDPTYVGWYLASLAFEQSVERAKEEERAQKERLRVERERKESAYAKGKAVIDQDIAEINAAIADSQVALVEAQNERDRALEQVMSPRAIAEIEAEFRPLFVAADEAIAQARLTIQTLQTDIAEQSSAINTAKRALALGRDLVLESELKTARLLHQTDLARLDNLIARDQTDIAILEEAIPNMESSAERGAGEQDILALKRHIRELQEQQTEVKIQIEEIDEQLPVQLAADRRVEIQQTVDAAAASIDRLRVEIEQIEETVRELQIERRGLDVELQDRVTALPGKSEQIAIRARFDARIDDIKSRIAVLRSNVADQRIKKADLVVEWR